MNWVLFLKLKTLSLIFKNIQRGPRNGAPFGVLGMMMHQFIKFCAKNKISVYNFFMAAYSLYLGRVSNLDDFVIGTPILNRTNFEQKHTMGMFISTAPLRINLEHEQSFIDFSKTIASNSMSLLRHQKYPYQSILEDLRKKDSSIPNLYNVILSYQITKTIEENTNVKLTATITCGDATTTKEFNLNVRARKQAFGEIVNSGESSIRVNKYEEYVVPHIYATDASSNTGSPLSSNFDTLTEATPLVTVPLPTSTP